MENFRKDYGPRFREMSVCSPASIAWTGIDEKRSGKSPPGARKQERRAWPTEVHAVLERFRCRSWVWDLVPQRDDPTGQIRYQGATFR